MKSKMMLQITGFVNLIVTVLGPQLQKELVCQRLLAKTMLIDEPTKSEVRFIDLKIALQ